MSLTVITNERCFNPDSLVPNERHLGTRDRFDVSKLFDYPGKAVGCLKAARMLQQRTVPEAQSTILGPLVNGLGKAVAPVAGSVRIEFQTRSNLKQGMMRNI